MKENFIGYNMYKKKQYGTISFAILQFNILINMMPLFEACISFVYW
jgi:hypothetical protein